LTAKSTAGKNFHDPSTFLLMRREICRSVGGLDENYVGSQHEDVDFCLKATSHGFKLTYVGNVSVLHYNCARNNSHSANFKYFQRRVFYINRKFGEKWFLNPKAGKFLRELYSQGVSDELEDVVKKLGYKPLDIKYLVSNYKKILI